MRVLFGAIREGPFFLCVSVSRSILHNRYLMFPLWSPFLNLVYDENGTTWKEFTSWNFPHKVQQPDTERRCEINTFAPCHKRLPMVIRKQGTALPLPVSFFSSLPLHSSTPTAFSFYSLFTPIEGKPFSSGMQDNSMQEQFSIAYNRVVLWSEL